MRTSPSPGSGDPSVEVSVDYSTADGTANAGSDYIAVPSTQLTFLPGETQKVVSVTVNGDPTPEPDETFVVDLSNAVGGDATISDPQGVGTILDDDTVAPTMHVGDLDAVTDSGRGGKWNATITIRVHDEGEAAIANAAVSGSWTNGASGSSSCTTDGSGQCSVTKNNISKHSSSATFTVDTVSHADYDYDEVDNHDPDGGDSDGTTIVVAMPGSGASNTTTQFVQAGTIRNDGVRTHLTSLSDQPDGQLDQEPEVSLTRDGVAIDAFIAELSESEGGQLDQRDDDLISLMSALAWQATLLAEVN